MTLSNVRGLAKLVASVTPADPLASNTYEIGSAGSNSEFSDANQLYSIKVSSQTGGDSTLAVVTGILTAAGTSTHAGGDGKDPDGEDVDFDTVYGLWIKNTGAVNLIIEGDSFSPAPYIITEVNIPAGGTFFWTAPDGKAFTAGNLVFGGTGTLAWELIAVGKIAA